MDTYVTNVGRSLEEIDGFVIHARTIFVLIASQKNRIFIHYFSVSVFNFIQTLEFGWALK